MLGVERIVSNELNANPQENSSSSSNAGERPKVRANKCVMMLLPHSFMILHWRQKLSHSRRATLSIKRLSQARLDANKKTSREAKTTCNRPSRNAAQGSQSCNSQLSRDRAEHSRNKAGKKGLILHWQQSWATAKQKLSTTHQS